jgi:hypothetical protein
MDWKPYSSGAGLRNRWWLYWIGGVANFTSCSYLQWHRQAWSIRCRHTPPPSELVGFGQSRPWRLLPNQVGGNLARKATGFGAAPVAPGAVLPRGLPIAAHTTRNPEATNHSITGRMAFFCISDTCT